MKVIKIHTCKVCPHYMKPLTEKSLGWSCDKRKYMNEDWDDNTIPNWCPLEDLTFFIGSDNSYITNDIIRGNIKAKDCACGNSCPIDCRGLCGCQSCYEAYDDFLSLE